jgi:hypothetical protein
VREYNVWQKLTFALGGESRMKVLVGDLKLRRRHYNSCWIG